MKPYTIEACAESIAEAVAAQDNGADQIELCRSLHLDGLTPDLSVIKEVVSRVNIPVKVMIRPRAGDNHYSQDEVAQMQKAIQEIKTLPIAGVVIGALTAEGFLDIPQIEAFVSAAAPLKVTIHKAIDQSNDPLSDLARLSAIEGINSVLSSGKAATALKGKSLLKTMIMKAPKGIAIIAAGKITQENLAFVHDEIGAAAYHGRRIVGQLF